MNMEETRRTEKTLHEIIQTFPGELCEGPALNFIREEFIGIHHPVDDVLVSVEVRVPRLQTEKDRKQLVTLLKSIDDAFEKDLRGKVKTFRCYSKHVFWNEPEFEISIIISKKVWK
jgi:hypothetical protein